jgi:quinol-cytochrome oxidoreductase complex cytochrome b subunit
MSEKQEENGVPFYPDHITVEAKVALGFGILVVLTGVLGLFFPVGLGAPADPMNTPIHVKPEWYFLFLYQLLQFIPKTIGATSPVIAILLLAIWPFLDPKPDSTKKPFWIRIWVSAAIILIIIALTIWGEVS